MKIIDRLCEECGAAFLAHDYQVARGRGRFCSISCGSSATVRRYHREHGPFIGPKNPNWHGGSSKRPIVYKLRFRAKFPEKAAAHDVFHAALDRKLIVRPAACESCTVLCRPHAHHDDYTKPLQVRWLCRTCHCIADQGRRALEAKVLWQSTGSRSLRRVG